MIKQEFLKKYNLESNPEAFNDLAKVVEKK